MKDIYYNLSMFHKAVKRNSVSVVYYNWLNFWFFTQKATINYTSDNVKDRAKLFDWFKKLGVKVKFYEYG